MDIKELNMKYISMKNIKKIKQFMFFMTETAQFLTVYSLYCWEWGTFLNFYSFISGVKDLNMKYMYMKNRKK